MSLIQWRNRWSLRGSRVWHPSPPWIALYYLYVYTRFVFFSHRIILHVWTTIVDHPSPLKKFRLRYWNSAMIWRQTSRCDCDFFHAGLSGRISKYDTKNSMIVCYNIIIVGFITLTLTSAGRLVVVCFDPSPSDDFTSDDGGATAAVATMGDWFPVLVPGSDFGGFLSSVKFRLCPPRAKKKKKRNYYLARRHTNNKKHTHTVSS